MSTKAVNPLDHIAIQNVIARYCIALDTKNFDRLDAVFLSDVEAKYPFTGTMNSLEVVKNTIRGRLGPIKTQHALTTQTIVFAGKSAPARAETAFTGAHFGQGPHEGKVLTAYGTYVDELVCVDAEGDFEGVEGASGKWRIKKREVIFTARIGDEKIMKEY